MMALRLPTWSGAHPKHVRRIGLQRGRRPQTTVAGAKRSAGPGRIGTFREPGKAESLEPARFGFKPSGITKHSGCPPTGGVAPLAPGYSYAWLSARDRRLRHALQFLVILILGLGTPLKALAQATQETPLWTFAWITDTQAREHEWVAALCERVKADKPKMVVHTGDLNFGRANTDIWKAVLNLMRHEQPPIELHLAYNAPHDPIQPPPGCDKNDRAEIYRAMVEYLDAGAGKVLDAVQKTGIADNTLVILMSDNGAEVNGGSSGRLKGLKRSVWEGGIRVPFIARYPGCIPAGGTTDKLAVSMDLFTTFANLAEARLPSDVVIDGKDILGMLAAEAGTPHENRPLFWAFGQHDAVRAGNWKLVRENGKVVGLYNIRDDEGEKKDQQDQSPQNQKRVEDLGKLLDDWRKTMRTPAGG